MPFGMTDAEHARFTSGEELPREEAYRLRELKRASILGTPAPTPQQPPAPPAPPAGMDPGFFNAMLTAGASAPVPPPPTISMAPPSPPQMPPPPVAPPAAALPAFQPPAQSAPPPPPIAPVLPPIAASIQELPQQAPVMSQVSPAPKAPADANVNNNVTMPTPTFTPAQERPALPTFQALGLSPNLGAYAPAPVMPGYGMPRPGSPFRATAPLGLPTFAAFGGGGSPSVSPQPYGQPEPDMGQNIMMRRPNLFNPYQ